MDTPIIKVHPGLTVIDIPESSDPYEYAYIPNGDVIEAKAFAMACERAIIIASE